MSKYAAHDHYVEEASGLLKNKLGITDEALLEQVEADYAAARSFELSQTPITGVLSPASLQYIHRSLFGDVYEWAGQFRNVDISKGASRFANWGHIESSLLHLFEKLQAENALEHLPPQLFSERAAYYMGELNAIHPFREGNGRTQRELLSQLAYRDGYSIAWHRVEPETILKATIQSFHGQLEPLKILIEQNLIIRSA
jgi:cell filamentation protein